MNKFCLASKLLVIINFIFALNVVETNSLKFMAIGDWGGIPIMPYKTLAQISVSMRMAEISEKENVDFILALGDNFYFEGVKNVYDRRFKETFENVYKNKSLQIPWLVLAGNHDHYGNASAQLDYSKISNRWIFPNYFYTKSFMVSKNSILDIVMIDTVLLCGNTDLNNPYTPPVLLEKDKPLADVFWSWLEIELKNSKANYLLVCGHYPVYSIALHGNTQCLVDRLVPLLEKYHVSAYFSGHDHNIQHIQVPGRQWQVEYFVSGAAGFIDSSTKNKGGIPAGSLKYHWGKFFSLGAFAYVETTNTKMTLKFLQGKGPLLYTYSFSPRFLNKTVHDML